MSNAAQAKPNGEQGADNGKRRFWALTLGSVGVVYGDIGTSPLYAFREALAHTASREAITEPMVLGVLSLILWSLILIVCAKYVLIVLRADNNGEGGALSLMALARRAMARRSGFVLGFGVVGAALFYGDAAITPAISVLSSVEGLKLVTPIFDPYVVPITIGIILGLFLVQSRGTAKVAVLFGPITVVWFLALAAAGASHIADEPAVLKAFNPLYGVEFLIQHRTVGFIALGSVLLAATGAESLYADLGHFGRKPIQVAWLGLVFPALTLNYLGQGALVLSNPEAAENPFFLLVPEWGLVPLVLLATAATTIASQAVITGAFSLTRQAIQLGILPRMEIRHTSGEHAGQIYLPRVNKLMMAAVIILVLAFQESGRLAAAYGIAITGCMVVTSLLLFVVMRTRWRWPLALSILVMTPFMTIELAFMIANLLKVADGGWVPLVMASSLIVLMITWIKGTAILAEKSRRDSLPLLDVVAMLEKSHPHQVPGTAMFLTSTPNVAPVALMHNLKHNKVLHDQNVIVTIEAAQEPYIDPESRVSVQSLSPRVMMMRVSYGYMESPNLPKALAAARKLGLKYDIMSTSFFLGRRSLRASPRGGMPLWQDRLYISLARNASDATEFFQIPSDRVIELGTQMTI
ncbi:potassium transporter Kup [Zavarzinia aquatilis]|uniref:Probable potassium transport system protein Kup n=1 Tax=Zavarzinia aquatilis TaxID=2211142 RepID=A0A317EI22_9PROT|nr:potassium transporter Kup [Zavarzinia aquatilis]PWR25974.1 potassium transporter Kup [Zavarzinia aquatilis]